MYIRLGTTNIKYGRTINDYMIISEVVDSKCSYESPVLVRDKDELDIYFGKDFTSRDYFDELLKNKVTLYLYRPISPDPNITCTEYIDLDKYSIYQENGKEIFFDSKEDLPDTPQTETIYIVKGTDLAGNTEINNPAYLHTYQVIWLGEDYGWTEVSQLAQNQGIVSKYSESWNNRDTLRIMRYLYNTGPEYVYPSYQEDTESRIYTEDIDQKLVLETLPDNLEDIYKGYQGYSMFIDYSGISKESIFEYTGHSPYIIINCWGDVTTNRDKEEITLMSGEIRVLFYFTKDQDRIVPPSTVVSKDYYDFAVPINTSSFNSVSSIIEELMKNISSTLITINSNSNTGVQQISIPFSYKIEKVSSTKYRVWNNHCFYISHFHTIPGLEIEDDFSRSQDILTQATDNDWRLEFTSRTTGTLGEDGEIGIKIEQIKNYNYKYRVTITRYDYSEVFEVNAFNISEKGEVPQRIDYVINRHSKLVRCHLREYYYYNGRKIKYTHNSSWSGILRTGEWKLRRATSETYYPEMYWEGLKAIKNEKDDIEIDFILIPNIRNYRSPILNTSYYPEYKTLLEYFPDSSMQFLIENKDNGYTYIELPENPKNPEKDVIYIINGSYLEWDGSKFINRSADKEVANRLGNSCIFNYNEGNTENRLVYFYRDMEVLGHPRPGYYLFLKGILTDVYSERVSNISYQAPSSDPYENTSFENSLEIYKSNYLCDNNQVYYYKKFLTREGDVSSPLIRFCIGKVTREIMKNKWDLLGKQFLGDIRSSLNTILENIKSRYSFIKVLYEEDIMFIEDTIYITISLGVSDLVDKNITLDITLNYNN